MRRDIYISILKILFRLRRQVITHERHTGELRVSVGDARRQVIGSRRSTLLGPRRQSSGERRHQRSGDVVQSEREVTLSAQSKVSATVSTVSRRTGQLWTATCPWRHRWPTRFVDICHQHNLRGVGSDGNKAVLSRPKLKQWSSGSRPRPRQLLNGSSESTVININLLMVSEAPQQSWQWITQLIRVSHDTRPMTTLIRLLPDCL